DLGGACVSHAGRLCEPRAERALLSSELITTKLSGPAGLGELHGPGSESAGRGGRRGRFGPPPHPAPHGAPRPPPPPPPPRPPSAAPGRRSTYCSATSQHRQRLRIAARAGPPSAPDTANTQYAAWIANRTLAGSRDTSSAQWRPPKLLQYHMSMNTIPHSAAS